MARLDKRRVWALTGSFLISVFLMYYISGQEKTEVERKVVLHIKAPEGMSVVGGPERRIRVRLSGSKNGLAVLPSEDLDATHVIEKVSKAGKYSFQLRDGDIDLPHPGISVTDIRPSVITVTLDEVVKKQLAVKANVVGSPAAGYVVQFDRIVTDPNAAVIKGPRSKLAKKEIVLTDAIDVVGRIRSFRIRVPLKYSSQYSVESSEVIDVFVPIIQQGQRRIISDVPIFVLNDSGSEFRAEIKQPTIELAVKGTEKVLQRVDSKSIKAYVDVTGLTSGDYQLPVIINFEDGLSLSQEVPVVDVSISKKDQKVLSSGLANDIAPAQEVQ